jgi:hypothetical protein
MKADPAGIGLFLGKSDGKSPFRPVWRGFCRVSGCFSFGFKHLVVEGRLLRYYCANDQV